MQHFATGGLVDRLDARVLLARRASPLSSRLR